MHSKLWLCAFVLWQQAPSSIQQATDETGISGFPPDNDNELTVPEESLIPEIDKREPENTPSDEIEDDPEDDGDEDLPDANILEKRTFKVAPKKCARVTEYCHKQKGSWKCYDKALENMICPKKASRRGHLTQYLCKLRELTKYCPPNSKKCTSNKPKICHLPKCSRNANTLITTCKCQYKNIYCYSVGQSSKCDEKRPRNMHCSRTPKIEGHIKRFKCRPRHVVQYIAVGESKPSKNKPNPCYRPRCTRRGHVTTCRCQYKVEFCHRKHPKCQGHRPRNSHCTRRPHIIGHIKRFYCRPRRIVEYVPLGQTKPTRVKPNPCYRPWCRRRGNVTTCHCRYQLEFCYHKNNAQKCQRYRPSNMHCRRRPEIKGHTKRFYCRPREIVEYVAIGEKQPSKTKPKPCYRPLCRRRGHITTCYCRYQIQFCYRKNNAQKCQRYRPRNMHCTRRPHIVNGQIKRFHCRPRHIVKYLAPGQTKPTDTKPKPCYRPLCRRRGHVTTCQCQYQVQFCYKKNKGQKCQETRPRNMHCTRKPKVVGHYKRFNCHPRKVVQYVPYGETKPTRTKPKYCYKPLCTRKAHVTTCKCQREEKYCVKVKGKWECSEKNPECPKPTK